MPAISGRAASSRPRRRDRRGRGLRGSLIPTSVPAHRTRAEQFDDTLLDALRVLDERHGDALAAIEFGVEDAPPEIFPGAATQVRLGRYVPASQDGPARIVIYRRPVESRAGDAVELAGLVHHVVVEMVAEALSMDPRDVDPDFLD